VAGNPFTPSFGSEPLVLAGRSRIIEDVLDGLDNRPGDPNRSSLFVGPRGSGKTVLLARIANEAAQHGWVAARVTAAPGMPDRLLEQIREAGAEYLPTPPRSRITGVTIQGSGVTREPVTPPSTWGKQLSDLVHELNDKSVGLLITVDEVSATTPGMIELATEFQQLVTDKHDVALLMAGLPGKVSRLLRDDFASFLRRAFLHRLDAVTIPEAELALRDTIVLSGRQIAPDALALAAAATEGYPFLIQLIGYHLWRQSPGSHELNLTDAKQAVELAQGDMDRMILDTTLQELSPKDLLFLRAMARDDGESSMRDVATRMHATPNLAGKYRTRLLEQGLIAEAGYGRVRFELPWLRRYLLEHPA